MFFSPVTSRSFRIRSLYLCFYILLALGAITMVIPFAIMLGGSVEPGRRISDSGLLPRYLYDDEVLWSRYIQAKYRNKNDILRMAWNDASANFEHLAKLPAKIDGLELWQEWVGSRSWPEQLFGLGFSDVTIATPYYYNRQFQRWLADRYQTIDALNSKLDTTFKSFNAVRPPNLSITGAALPETPFVEEYFAFCQTTPAAHRYAWDAGGYYRAIFLPRTIGPEIADYNRKFGTSYLSYAEVPFPAEVPQEAAESWMLYVTKLLRPEFIEFTSQGQARFAASGVSKGDFIRTLAESGDLKVVSPDRLFAEWAEWTHGLKDERIPQYQIDGAAFQREKSFWRGVFVVQNYQYVIDEIFINGRAMKNTAILVALMILGTLTVNPLAAYALSRFKLKQSYYILLFFLATISFPAEVTMIPVFLQLKELNLLNTFGALVLPSLANGFAIFLLKGFFDNLPKELYEAAELDGASEWRMFWLIAMNLSKPILAVNVLSAFVAAYGAFFYALILAPDPKIWTIMVYIYQLQQVADPPVVYASLIIVAIPTLLIFIFCQNIILRGIVVPSEK